MTRHTFNHAVKAMLAAAVMSIAATPALSHAQVKSDSAKMKKDGMEKDGMKHNAMKKSSM
ncbi:MAG: hypothetical protein ABJC26_05730 [Gemmatimonadaceae bacterium]